jgi:hypothetical protein
VAPLDAEVLRQAKEARERLLDLQHEVERARADYQHSIRRLHAAGGSLREISENLGLSHQRVHQIVEAASGEPTSTGARKTFVDRVRGRVKWPFERFTRRARQVVLLAEEESRELKHDYIGTEHILLGLLRVEDGLAAQALASLGISLEEARREVVRIIGRGSGAQSDRAPFTPRAKKVLELALREALDLKHNYIGTEHILLGLARENEGVASQILLDLGADAETIRAAILRMLAK